MGAGDWRKGTNVEIRGASERPELAPVSLGSDITPLLHLFLSLLLFPPPLQRTEPHACTHAAITCAHAAPGALWMGDAAGRVVCLQREPSLMVRGGAGGGA